MDYRTTCVRSKPSPQNHARVGHPVGLREFRGEVHPDQPQRGLLLERCGRREPQGGAGPLISDDQPHVRSARSKPSAPLRLRKGRASARDRLEYCELDDRAAEVLGHYLRQDSCQLVGLSIAHNVVRDTGLAALAAGLQHATLQSLDLSFNGLKRVEPLAHALKSQKTLTSLNLSMNGIEDVAPLVQVVQVNHSLRSCCLLWNMLADGRELAAAGARRRSQARTAAQRWHSVVAS
eukprot:7383265-Prymnesium_polylepis.2